jgi:transcriptional regulator of heat shock response
MNITSRQEEILNALIQEYISTAEPVGSIHLKKSINFDVCPATTRNDLHIDILQKKFAQNANRISRTSL